MYSACFALKENDEAKKWGERILSTRGSDIETAPLIDLGMVFYELNQFDEAYKYFNVSYNYVKERTFQDRAEKYLEFYFPKGAQVRFFHKKQIKL